MNIKEQRKKGYNKAHIVCPLKNTQTTHTHTHNLSTLFLIFFVQSWKKTTRSKSAHIHDVYVHTQIPTAAAIRKNGDFLTLEIQMLMTNYSDYFLKVVFLKHYYIQFFLGNETSVTNTSKTKKAQTFTFSMP